MTVEEIKDKYSMMDILNRLNISVKKGFCNCPLHKGDRTASCRIYPTSFYCFGCGKGGDIISFIEEYYHIGFADACEWISGEELTKKNSKALAIALIKRKAQQEKLSKIRSTLSQMRMAEDWNLFLTEEPFSDKWTDAYNRWQLNVYKQEELMKELGL